MDRVVLYALALLGAALSKAGDWLGTMATRQYGSHVVNWLDVGGAVAWTLCYPVWRWMSIRSGGSFTTPASLWDVSSAILSVIIGLCANETESAAKRALFIVIVVCGVARKFIE